MNYRSVGVDIEKGDRIVDRVKEMMGAAGAQIGHFGGAIPIPTDRYKKPLLVSSIDSVGTKVMVATAVGTHKKLGYDIVHHCINDIVCCGAEPIAFLDYIAMSALDEKVVTEAIEGIIGACQGWNVTLVGGETAEMPGTYLSGEYDLVGSISGLVDQDEFIDGKSILPGDVLVGFGSNGLHTNGYSLARKVCEPLGYSTVLPELDGTIGDALLKPHRCYLGEIRELKRLNVIKGLAHITGGGLLGNVTRIIPKGLTVNINWGCWSEPPIFTLIQKEGNVSEEDMRPAFNLGIGFVAVMTPENAQRVLNEFPDSLESPIKIGQVA